MTNLVPAGTPGSVEVTVWDLEMTSAPVPPAHDGDAASTHDLMLQRAVDPAPELARFFYIEVGREFNWHGRTDWTRQQWAAEAALPTNHLWSCWRRGVPVGYFMLDENTQAIDGNTELKYFGLLPRHHGQGIGKWLLTKALEQAWALPSTNRLWLHTCSLDGPHAKTNYLARGFRQCGETTEHQLLIPASDA